MKKYLEYLIYSVKRESLVNRWHDRASIPVALLFHRLETTHLLSSFTKRPTLSDAVACPFNGQLHAGHLKLKPPSKASFPPH